MLITGTEATGRKQSRTRLSKASASKEGPVAENGLTQTQHSVDALSTEKRTPFPRHF
jgi:hypothetical protein